MRKFLACAGVVFSFALQLAGPADGQDYRPGDIPYFADDFSLDLRYWWWEGGTPEIKEGELCLNTRGSSILWCRLPFRGKISVEYRARVVIGLGPNDRLSDLDFYWMTAVGSEPMDVRRFFEARSAGEMADGAARVYRIENGGDGNRVTRLTRYDRDGRETVLAEYADRALLLEPNQDYRFRLVIGYWLLELYRDGKLALRIDDPNLITPGYFGLAAEDNHVHFDDVRVDYLLPDPPPLYPDFFPDERRERVDPETGNRVVQLTSSSEYHSKHGYYDTNPWTADGRLVYARARRGSSTGAVYVMDREGRSRKVADGARFGMHTGANPQWALGGNAVVFASAENQSGIALVDVRTGEVRDPSTGVLRGGQLDLVSPDGTRITYFLDRRQLWIIDLTGASQPRLVIDADRLDRETPFQKEVKARETHIQHGKWSPDGTKLLLVHTNELPRLWTDSPDLIKDLYLVDVATGEFRRLCPFSGHPVWHPSGTAVYFVWKGGTWKVDTTTGAVTPVTDKVGGGHPSYRSDGRAIVGDLAESLVVYDVATGSVRKAADVPSILGHEHLFGTHSHPTWSPDGSAVLYDSDQTGVCQIYMVYPSALPGAAMPPK